MNVVFYSSKSENEGQQLLSALRAPLRGRKIRTFRSVDSLGSFLRNFPRPETVVLLASSMPELSRLVALKKHFEDVPLILILPDRSESSLNRACALGPLMTCFQDGAYSDVAAMVSRIRTLRQEAMDRTDPRRFAWSGAIPYLSSFSPYEDADLYSSAEAGGFA